MHTVSFNIKSSVREKKTITRKIIAEIERIRFTLQVVICSFILYLYCRFKDNV